MGRYATQTSVPISASRAEIEQCLIKYGASEFHSGWQEDKALIAFRLKSFFVRFILPLPDKSAKKFKGRMVRGYWKAYTERQQEEVYDQECRSRWRALLLAVKAKLEAVEVGISTLEQEFLAFIVLPNQATLGEWVVENALPFIKQGKMPLALTGPKPEEVQDAEIVQA